MRNASIACLREIGVVTRAGSGEVEVVTAVSLGGPGPPIQGPGIGLLTGLVEP